jgi:predicted nucleic acid-binding protein
MSHFPDTSFLCALYRPQVHSVKADGYMASLAGPLTVSSLLLLEFRQSVRLQIKLHIDDRTKGFPSVEGQEMLRDLQSDLNAGILSTVPVDWADVHLRAEVLSGTYTVVQGHRFADLLHVATALHLGVEEFLTFDTKQNKLAEGAGIVVPV